MHYPQLPETIGVLEGVDLDHLWQRFHVLEAMHHEMAICNPMSDGDLDKVLKLLNPTDGDHMLDMACGHGEFLIRAAAMASVRGRGIDLSPWVLMRAEQRAREFRVEDRLTWTVGDVGELLVAQQADITSCFGASWVWDGFEGTVDALISHTRPGGRLAFGDVQRRDGADPAELTEAFGTVSSRDEQKHVLAHRDLAVLGEIVPDPGSWIAYDRRVAAGAQSFHDREPGRIASEAMEMQAGWARDEAQARRNVRWTVWVVELPS